MSADALRLLELAALAAAGGGLAAWGQRAGAGARQRPASHGWAGRRDLTDLTVPADTAGRIPLGEFGRATLAALPNHHVLGVGASQSFKTSGLAVRAVRGWAGPQLVLSAKPDLYYATVDQADPTQVVLDLTGELPAGHRTVGWSPLDGAAGPMGALRVGEMLARAATPADLRAASFWTERGALILAGLLLAYAQHPGRHDLTDLLRAATTEDTEEPVGILRGLTAELADQLADALDSLSGSKAREYRGGVYATVQSALSVYLDPAVLAASRTPGRFRPSMLRDGTISRLYIVGSLHDQRRLTPLVLAFLDEVERDWSAAHLRRGRTPYGPAERLLLVLDEATQLAPIRNLPQLLAVAAGIGINVLLLLQDVAQLLALYGQHGARDILGNCHAKLLMSGVTDPDTLEAFRAALGDEQVPVPTVTTSSGRGQRSRTTGTTLQRMPLAEVSDLRQQQPGTGTLIYLHRKPARPIRLNPQRLETAPDTTPAAAEPM